MSKAPFDHPDLFFPAVVTPRGDGTFIVKAGKPVPQEVEITAKAASEILKCSLHSVYRYIEEGLLASRQVKEKGRVWVLRSEVMALKNRERGDEG